MSYNRIGEDFYISGSVSAAGFYGDGTGLTGIIGVTGPAGASGTSGTSGVDGTSGTSGTSFTGTGTLNYVAKWNNSNGLQDSNIQDDGYPNGIGINYAPQSGIIMSVGNAVQPTTAYLLNNYATSSTITGLQINTIGTGGTGPKVGLDIFVPTGANNYAMKLQDGRQASGYVLTSDASGNAYWAPSSGGGSSASSISTSITSSGNLGYRRGTSKLYRLTRLIDSYNVTSGLINGESIWLHTFQCSPGEKINEIAFRIMTAGGAGLGLAECRILIYRTKLNAAGEIVGGDIELDTGVQINTLTTGIKVVTGLNHTLSSNTYKDLWFIGIRNYQTGTLSIKTYSNTDTATLYADVASSGSTMFRDNAWYFTCAWNAAVPTLMPMTASTATGPNVLTPNDTVVPYIGISAV